MEFLEDELDRQSLVKRRLTCTNFNRRGGGIRSSEEQGEAVLRYKSNFSDDEETDRGA